MDGGGWPDRWAKSVRGDLFRLRPKNFRKLGLDHTRKDENQKFSDSKQVVLRSLAEIIKADEEHSGLIIPNDDSSRNRIGFRKNF